MTENPKEHAAALLDEYRKSGTIDFSNLDLVLNQALSENEETAKAGTGAFFGNVVEPLCDSFSKDDRNAYYRVMAHAIQSCRNTPGGEAVDAALKRFGLDTEEDLVRRTLDVVAGEKCTVPDKVNRVYLLSRVTLGADVSVTSVAINRMRHWYPDAKIIIIGSAKLAQFFGGDSSIEIVQMDYPRRGGLSARIAGWLAAVSYFESVDFSDTDLLLDPDTRQGQVGLLPFVHNEENYHFFEAIPDSVDDARPLGVQFGDWLDSRFGKSVPKDKAQPFIALQPKDLETAETILAHRDKENPKVITMSLGVGGNLAKRLGPEFESSLLSALLAKNCLLVIDKGGDAKEAALIDKLVAGIGREAATFTQETFDQPLDTRPDIILWEGAIGPFAALIELSDGYVGYDSLFQHVAAGLGRPVATVFTGYINKLFTRRWKPWGPGKVTMFTIDSGKEPPSDLVEDILKALGI